MLSTATASGLAPDAALPMRDLLLDADLVAERLADLLGGAGPLHIEGCELVRVKYRIGESLRVVYRLTVGSERHLVAARAFRGGRSARAYRAALEVAAGDSGSVRPVVHDAGLDAVWWTFPNDRRLRDLACVLRPTSPVSDLVPPGPGRWRTSEVAEYAPERSATFRCLDDDRGAVAYAKVYAPGSVDVRQLATRYDCVATALARAGDAGSAPRALGWDLDRSLLLLQAMPGVGWGSVRGGDLDPGLDRLGVAIATLHGADWSSIELPRFARLDAARVEHSAELIGIARPDVARQAAELARRLAATRPVESEQVFLHGDCHPKNALLDGGRVALIDLDQAGHGAPAADVGSLLARLRHGALLGEHADAESDRRAAAFLAGYARIRPLPPADSLRWHIAAALLVERAMRAVNRVHVPALRGLDELLATATRSLEDGGAA